MHLEGERWGKINIDPNQNLETALGKRNTFLLDLNNTEMDAKAKMMRFKISPNQAIRIHCTARMSKATFAQVLTHSLANGHSTYRFNQKNFHHIFQDLLELEICPIKVAHPIHSQPLVVKMSPKITFTFSGCHQAQAEPEGRGGKHKRNLPMFKFLDTKGSHNYWQWTIIDKQAQEKK